MECPKCGTWNPDDKARCWRCSAELPLPPKPRKSRKLSSQTWLWVVAILFSLLTLLAQCGFFGGGSDQGTGFKFAPPIRSLVVRWEPLESEVDWTHLPGAELVSTPNALRLARSKLKPK
jgi:hypothetical protein